MIAFALLGAAHRVQPASASLPQSVDLSAYALPDGTLPIICFTKADNGSPNPSQAIRFCDACLITKAPGLAPTDEILLVSRRSRPLFSSIINDGMPAGRIAGLALSRAPPQSAIIL